MARKSLKIFVLIVIALLSSFIFFSVFNNSLRRPEIYFLDVGQGDSALIRLPGNKNVLIDGGPDNLVIQRLGKIIPFYQKTIDLMILSHPHDDHITGLIETIRRYQISTLIYMWQDRPTELLKMLLLEAKKKNVKIIELKDRANLKYQMGCELKIINPESLEIKEDPNNSLVVKINCISVSALFTGDNNSSVEARLLQTGEDWSAQIFKAAHHGSKTANSVNFLKAIHPSLLIISVGILNRFGHPNAEVIERVVELGINIKRTDKDGTIKIR